RRQDRRGAPQPLWTKWRVGLLGTAKAWHKCEGSGVHAMAIAVALVEPQYPVNVGHVARLMKNFGLRRLYMVNPHYDSVEAVRYATHGKDVLASAKVVTLKQLRKKF